MVQPKKLKRDMRSGTWNVRSLYWSGSLLTVTNDLARYKLELVGVQEVRWEKGGTVRAGSILFSMENKNHQSRTGLIVHHRIESAVNPLPVQFKSLLPGQEGFVFFSGPFKYTYLPLRFTMLRPAGGISIHYVLLR
jgi:hypothetical protein